MATLEEQNSATVMAYFDRLQQSDGEGMAAYLAPELSYWVCPGSKYSGTYDRNAFLGVLPGFFEKQAAPLRFQFEEITAQQDRVCVLAWGKMPLKSGERYDNVYHYMFRLRGGKIVQVKEFFAKVT
jgi:uncharacterized protein